MQTSRKALRRQHRLCSHRTRQAESVKESLVVYLQITHILPFRKSISCEILFIGNGTPIPLYSIALRGTTGFQGSALLDFRYRPVVVGNRQSLPALWTGVIQREVAAGRPPLPEWAWTAAANRFQAPASCHAGGQPKVTEGKRIIAGFPLEQGDGPMGVKT